MKSKFTIIAAIAATLTHSALAQESESPAPPSENSGTEVPPVKQLSETEFQLGDILFNKATRRIQFPGRINTREDLLEYILVHDNGKTHESLLATAISPFQLNIVMLLCGYHPDEQGLFGTPEANTLKSPDPESPPSNILLSISWTPENEAPVSSPVEKFILNRFTDKAMAPGPWQYNGSTVENGQFQAEVEGSIIAIYLDRWAMFNSPRRGNDDDLRWKPIAEKLPPKHTPITIVINPAPPHQPESK